MLLSDIPRRKNAAGRPIRVRARRSRPKRPRPQPNVPLSEPVFARQSSPATPPPKPAAYSSSAARASASAIRSAGSAERTSISSPVIGCSNASRAACRNWRSKPVEPGRSVLGVAADRVADRRHVNPDLVGAAGVEHDSQERRRAAAAARSRSGSAPPGARRCRSTSEPARGDDGRSERRSSPSAPAGGPRRARDIRGAAVSPPGAPSASDGRRRSSPRPTARMCRGRAGERFPLARAPRPRPPRDAASAWASVPVRWPRRWVHDHPRGLVDNQQLIVLPRDDHVRRLAPPAGGSARRQFRAIRSAIGVDLDPLAAFDQVALRPRAAVHQHPPRVDQALRSRARPEPPGEELIQPGPGGVVRDIQLQARAARALIDHPPACPPAPTAAPGLRT